MAGRENWSSRKAFILAAIGSAIGLGNNLWLMFGVSGALLTLFSLLN